MSAEKMILIAIESNWEQSLKIPFRWRTCNLFQECWFSCSRGLVKVVNYTLWQLHCALCGLNTTVCLTSELAEWCVRLQVKTLPVLVERLHTEFSGLLYGRHGHMGHHGIDVVPPTDLQDEEENRKRNNLRETSAKYSLFISVFLQCYTAHVDVLWFVWCLLGLYMLTCD